MVFPGAWLTPPPGGAAPPGAQVHRRTPRAGVEIEAWLFPPLAEPPRVSSAGSARPDGAPVMGDTQPFVLIYLHGNGEIIDQHVETAGQWRKRGAWVFLPEFRGYGRSGGRPSRAAIRADMLQWTAWLAEYPEVAGLPVVLHGRSLGGGIAADLAADLTAAGRPPAALILESTFTSVDGFAWRMLVPPVLIRHRYRPIDVVRAAGYPVLILHGRKDEVVGGGAGPALRDAAPPGVATYHEFDAGHNDFELGDPGAYWAAIDAFLARGRPE